MRILRICFVLSFAILTNSKVFAAGSGGVLVDYGVVHLSQPGQSYVVDSDIGALVVEAPDIKVTGGKGKILGDLKVISAPRSEVSGVIAEGRIAVLGSSFAKVTNSRASELLVEGGEDITTAANVITGGCTYSSTNGVTITGQICSSMWLAGSAASPFTRSTIRYNIIRNTITNLDGQPGDLGKGRMSELLGAADTGDSLNGPCPTTNHVIEYNYFEGRHQGSAHDDEPFIFRFRCARGTAIANNIIRFNTFVATGNQVGVYLRDHVDFLRFEGNAILTHAPRFYSALLLGSGNDGIYSDNPSDDLFIKNLISAEQPLTGAIYSQGADGNMVYQENVIRTANGTPALVLNIGGPNHFDHNTFVGGGATAVTLDYNVAGATQAFANNLLVTTGATPVQFAHSASSLYSGDRNLFYNTAGTTSVPSADTNARTGNPAFLNAPSPSFDFRIGSTSAARMAGSDTSDRGAFQFNQSCTGIWQCSDWSACINSEQIRICPGLNDCGQPNPQPYQTRACGSTDVVAPGVPTNLQVH